MTYIPYRERKRNTAWFSELENGFQSFLDSGNWLYNFENEYLQPKKQDIEARYLSQYFFSKLINRMNNTYTVEITDSTYMHAVYKDKRTKFHFDVMHNPKECHIFGKAVKNSAFDQSTICKGIYYTIDTFTPLLWPSLEHRNITL